MIDYFWEMASLLLRWLHVVAAIAWIGESFYFVALDRGLQPPARPQPNLAGESWSVHGGGFYHKQKYLPAPLELPTVLHWSKWKSYATWLSGFLLFAVIYLRQPEIQLIDPEVAALSPSLAIILALAFPLLGWLIYDSLCDWFGVRAPGQPENDRTLGVLVALLVLVTIYAATHLFAGRAAFLLVGAVLATIMSANVFFVIIPGQRRMVAALARGEAPDPLPGLQGKQRSVHNTYFTLPVVFAMLANHWGNVFAHPHNGLLLALFMAAGALIRQFFVVWHSGQRAWRLLAVGLAVLLAALAWLAPTPPSARSAETADSAVAAAPDPAGGGVGSASVAAVVSDDAVLQIFAARCGGCHSATPRLMGSAPKGTIFDQLGQIEASAALIHKQVVELRIMPPGNLTGLSEDERSLIARWTAARMTAGGPRTED